MRNIENITQAHEAVSIYFLGSDCGVCHALLPKLKELFEKDFPRIDFQVVDIQKEPYLASEIGVFSAATVVVYFEGKELIRKSRAFGIEELRREISRPYELFFS